MKKKKTFGIVIEKQQRVTIRKSSHASFARCRQCSRPLVSANEAVAMTGLNSRAIHRLVETGEIHFAETPVGALLSCLGSLWET